MTVPLDATTRLADGSRLRLRLPHAGDRDGVRALLARLGLDASDLEIARALRFDPRRRTVLVATTWTGTRELLVGLAATGGTATGTTLVLADEPAAPGLGALLRTTLAAHPAAA